ncbi:hypothetical protein C8Q80DRAFT_1125039 [Daedaleopsis nitida]|nr:hypothetical protein C8Q80DRAFT_1125039 [Daedaleopsis nitida]
MCMGIEIAWSFTGRKKAIRGRARVAASMVEKQLKYDLGDKETAWLIATIHLVNDATYLVHSAAAVDTMSVTMVWFMLAMVLYPRFQRKAQEEVDRIVGRY